MQNLQLSIPEPCHENWQQMTPTDQGRFCNACAKEVIDFSTMTDIQVLSYFTNMTNEKVCGRVLPEQLDRTISRPEQPKKRLFWYWNYFVMFFMFFGKGNSAKAQGGIKPVTEINPVKANDIRGEIATVTKQQGSRIISGKVIDINGNPVSFASVKIKGTNSGVVADANGVYSLKVNSHSILSIYGGGFKEAEVLVGLQSNVNIVLERDPYAKEVIVTVAGGIRRTARTNTVQTSAVNSKIIFEVKEDNTGLPISKAAITLTRKGDNLSHKIVSDNKGIYKFTEIKISDNYFIKVEAEGYDSNEFTIDAKDIKEREKGWEVLLKKKKTAFGMRRGATQQIIKGDVQTHIIGQTFVAPINTDSLYIIDGLISTQKKAESLSLDDIEESSVLQGPAAAALFGPEGANGAIVIATRKAKEIKMKEVVVNSNFGCTRRSSRGGAVSYTYTYEDSFLTDTIATVKTLLTNSIKVYPNPVPRNTAFSVALKLKQTGNYNMQITDASGRIFLQQKLNANSKDHTEKIMSDSRWAAGVYYIRVFDSKNQLISKTSFIFE